MNPNPNAHIAIVDDDPAIRDGVSRYLSEQGLRATSVADSREARNLLRRTKVDLILLDVMLPGETGLALLRELRTVNAAPVILLTAVSGEVDRVVGLELGAEDYICKPFSLRELLARIRIVLRRQTITNDEPPSNRASIYRFEQWRLDARGRSLTSPTGGYVDLTTGEFDLLLVFLDHPNQVLNRDYLLDLTRGRSSPMIDRTIDVQIMRLRRKLEGDPQSPRMIKTVRNGGYLFTPVVERDRKSVV